MRLTQIGDGTFKVKLGEREEEFLLRSGAAIMVSVSIGPEIVVL